MFKIQQVLESWKYTENHIFSNGSITGKWFKQQFGDLSVNQSFYISNIFNMIKVILSYFLEFLEKSVFVSVWGFLGKYFWFYGFFGFPSFFPIFVKLI